MAGFLINIHFDWLTAHLKINTENRFAQIANTILNRECLKIETYKTPKKKPQTYMT